MFSSYQSPVDHSVFKELQFLGTNKYLAFQLPLVSAVPKKTILQRCSACENSLKGKSNVGQKCCIDNKESSLCYRLNKCMIVKYD